jgi:MOSC domain-containing protein YiiM
VNVSSGGVPKRPVERARVTQAGVEGDAQHDTRHHGGPERAVCLFSLEVIHRLRAEGHPIEPGSTGENVTLEGLEWSAIGPGDRLVFAEGGPTLLITGYARPCAKIRGSFLGGAVSRIEHERHWGESRVYARVLTPGELRPGQEVRRVDAGEAVR